jgi:small subunit ribosomal protein S7
MRRRAAVKREVIPEPKYGSELLSQFINRIMVSGKKSLAERIVYQSLDILLDKVKKSPELSRDNEHDDSRKQGGSTSVIHLFEQAISEISPQIEVKSRRVGGATYQIPIEVAPARRISLAMRWVIAAARRRGEKDISGRVAGELFDALNKRGEAFKKREDTYRMAKANQAFAHFGWK